MLWPDFIVADIVSGGTEIEVDRCEYCLFVSIFSLIVSRSGGHRRLFYRKKENSKLQNCVPVFIHVLHFLISGQ